MTMGRPIPPLQLSREEGETLERWVRRPSSAQALSLRARIILTCAQGKTNTEVAWQMHLAKPTVGKWRSRFLTRRLDGLLDEPRPGAPREISDAAVERVLTLGNPPARGHALVDALDGPPLRTQSKRGQPHLACFRSPAASRRDLSAFQGPAVH